MENNLNASPPAAAAPAAPAAPAPVAPIAPTPAPGYVMNDGGGVPAAGSASIVKQPGFFSGITLSETLITGLVVFGLFYNIYYIRQKSLYLQYLKQTGASAPASTASSSGSSTS